MSPRVESENDESFSSSEQLSGEIFPYDQSFDKDQVQSTQSVPASRNVMKARQADRPKYPSKDNLTSSLGPNMKRKVMVMSKMSKKTMVISKMPKEAMLVKLLI
ncbi:hypothetical protein QYF36_021553 [Acer negundo]|nr:hypothetical protein QYF36_021553 [Acer negundo]